MPNRAGLRCPDALQQSSGSRCALVSKRTGLAVLQGAALRISACWAKVTRSCASAASKPWLAHTLLNRCGHFDEGWILCPSRTGVDGVALLGTGSSHRAGVAKTTGDAGLHVGARGPAASGAGCAWFIAVATPCNAPTPHRQSLVEMQCEQCGKHCNRTSAATVWCSSARQRVHVFQHISHSYNDIRCTRACLAAVRRIK